MLFIRLMCALGLAVSVNAHAQVSYNTVNLIANITSVTYDSVLANYLKSGTTPVSGVAVDTNASRPWPAAILRLTIDKNFTCSGVSTNKIALIAADADTQYLISRPLSAMDAFATTSFIHGYKIKVSRVVCGSSPNNGADKIGFVFLEKDISPVSGLPAGNASWINGVVVNAGGAAPTNPVSTNWGFEITTAGTYEVYAHWVSNKNTVSDISYSFNGEAAVSANLDQNISSGIWVKLGVSKSFTAGSHSITIAVDPTAFYVVDGIKVERVQ